MANVYVVTEEMVWSSNGMRNKSILRVLGTAMQAKNYTQVLFYRMYNEWRNNANGRFTSSHNPMGEFSLGDDERICHVKIEKYKVEQE